MRTCLERLAAAGCLALAITFPARAAATTEVDCVVRPSRVIDLGSPVSGVLAEVRVGRGDRVSPGDLLARMEDSVQAAAVTVRTVRAQDRTLLAAQRARLDLAEARMARTRELFQRGSASEQALDEAIAELAVNRAEIDRLEMSLTLAEAELRQAEAVLALRRITSTVDALVTDHMLTAGEFVGQDDRILRLAVLDPLHVEAFLPTALFDQLLPGQRAQVRLRQPSAERESTVAVIDRVFDAASDTLRLRVDLDNADWRIPAGQRCILVLPEIAASRR